MNKLIYILPLLILLLLPNIVSGTISSNNNTIVFYESGYTGEWGIIIDNTTYYSYNNTITINTPNIFNYHYIVIVPNGYNSNVIQGNITQLSSSIVNIVFTANIPQYEIIFNEYELYIVTTLLMVGFITGLYVEIKYDKKQK